MRSVVQLEIRQPRKSLVPALQRQSVGRSPFCGASLPERAFDLEWFWQPAKCVRNSDSSCPSSRPTATACSLKHHYIPLWLRTSARSRSAIRSDDTFPDSTVVRPYYTGESLDLGRSQGPLMNNKLVSSPRGPPLGQARSARIRIPIVTFRIGLRERENCITVVRSSILGGGAAGIP